MSTEIYLARHGQSEWNADTAGDRLNGRTDVELTAEGYRQAACLARALSSVRLAAVYCSPLRRARETARAVAEQQGLPLISKEWLSEIECGAWEGLTLLEAETKDSAYYVRWLNDPALFPFPEGEGVYDVAARVMPRLAQLALQHDGETILLVSHKIVSCVILAHYLGVHPAGARRLVPQHTAALNCLVVEASRAIQVKMIDDHSHLYD